MTKYIEEAKVVGQWILNTATKEIDLIAPRIAAEAVPGQFVNVQVSRHTAPLLRRPLGIARVDREHGVISLIYRVIGEATRILADVCSGDVLSVVGPLGNGFDRSARKPLLVGGGTGLAPLLNLAEAFKAEGIVPHVLMGGRTEEELFWKDLYEGIAGSIALTTDDGTLATSWCWRWAWAANGTPPMVPSWLCCRICCEMAVMTVSTSAVLLP